MAVDDIGTLKTELPEVFGHGVLPPDWEDEWILVPVNQPDAFPEIESKVLSDFEDALIDERQLSCDLVPLQAPLALPAISIIDTTGELFAHGQASFAGAPIHNWKKGGCLPPDACAFYLPFHYFYPEYWGIYLVPERVEELAGLFVELSRGKLNLREALRVTRLFLYGHEFYHHRFESFATRLEVTHRKPLYKTGFETAYRQAMQGKSCPEEVLACAHGFELAKHKAPKDKKAAVVAALKTYLDGLGAPYENATKYFTDKPFATCENGWQETCHRNALESREKGSGLWSCFSQGTRGIGDIRSRVVYLVHRGSRFAQRIPHDMRALRYREVAKKLRDLAGCEIVRDGKGSHAVWRGPNGKTFPVPRHPGDLCGGTLSKIIKQAGLEMPLSEFVRA